MNLSELSDLSKVIEHLKSVINTAGVTRFNNQTLTTLNKRLSELEEIFITSMIDYHEDNRNTAKIIHEAVQMAREKMKLDEKYPTSASNHIDPVRIEKSVDSEQDKPTKNRKTKIEVKKSTSSSNVVEESVEPVSEVKDTKSVALPTYLQDEAFSALLATEKQKVATRKRKSA